MVKKRVHEVAKELGFTNRDMIEKLQKLGMEVKSHSSSVDIDEVRLALRKEEDTKKDNTEERRVSTGIIRRRPKGEEAAPVKVVRRAGGAARKEEPVAAAPVESESEAKAATESAVQETPSATESPVETAAAPETTEASATETVAEAEGAEPEVQAADGQAEGDASVEAAAEATEDDDKKGDKKGARLARPEKKPREEAYDEEDDKPEIHLEEFGISENDFMRGAEEAPAARVAPPPPSTKIAARKSEEPGSKVLRRIDPAVLKARLKDDAKRPEPPKDWGRQEVAASPVTELVVRTDASGKRRELVDVRKEAAKGGKGGKTGARRREEMSAKDLLEHRRGQVFYPAPNRKRVKGKKTGPRRPEGTAPENIGPIMIGETITVADLAKQMSVKGAELIRWFMGQGVMAAINQPVTHDLAAAAAEQFGCEVQSLVFEEEEFMAGEAGGAEQAEDPDAVLRAPVVTVMGHVDHGKTTLLDYIRKANVAAGEAGGITQRIAGYQVKTPKGNVTFLDTPGHAAFTAMRARGATVTDIVILVVAADDGVMPQTIEAIEHAKAAKVPIIVAVNKIDKPEANPDRVLQQLTQYGIQVEAWGGDVLCQQVSAKAGTGVQELLEQLALQAEILELKANPNLPARGSVIEAQVDKGKGPVATILVQEGTLSVGDVVVVGEAIGKVRALMSDSGRRVKDAGPSTPVQVLGLSEVPQPGDEVRTAKSVEDARNIAANRRDKRRAEENTGHAKVSLQDLFAKMQSGEKKELKLLVKADLQGSLEAVRDALEALSNDQVKVSVIRGGVGAVTESDIEFATASEAVIIGFAVRPDTNALKAARTHGVQVRTHKIIYEAVDEVLLAMQGLLAMVEKEKYLGRAEVRQTFNVPKVGTVAGCAIVDGTVSRAAQIRLLRDGRILYEGKLASLKRFKDDVREVKEGFECGMGIEKFNDIQVGDLIESFEMIEVRPELEAPGPRAPEARA